MFDVVATVPVTPSRLHSIDEAVWWLSLVILSLLFSIDAWPLIHTDWIGDNDDNSPFNVAQITLLPGLDDGSEREAGLCRAHSCCVV